MATGVIRLKLKSIYPGISNFIVVGIIIAKRNPKVIITKKGKLISFIIKFKS